MTVFTAYFDGSGSPDEGKALVVAGYLAAADQWDEFSREWTECLTGEGVAAFHMRDFAHSLREFAFWNHDETRRKRFLERLIRIVKMRVRKSIANAVLLDAYDRVNAEFMFSEHIGPPYALCGMACMKIFADGQLKRSVSMNGRVASLRMAINTKRNSNNLIARFEDWPDPIFEAKSKNRRPFEAADLIARENRKLYTEAESGSFSNFRKSFSELQKISPTWFVYTESELRSLCATFQVPKRGVAAGSVG
jgi:hypothetical protein